MASPSDKLSNALRGSLDAVIDEFALAFSESAIKDVVVSTLTKVWGLDNYGFRAGYGDTYGRFVSWFYGIPGIRERMNTHVGSALTVKVLEKARLASMKDIKAGYIRGLNDSYNRKRQQEEAFQCFSEYAKLRAKADAKAIYEAARDQYFLTLESKESTTAPTTKTPSKRKKSCSEPTSVVQDT